MWYHFSVRLTEEHPTRRALVECARDLIAVHGVDKVTVDMVLSESKISKGSLYHHFRDFDQLIQTVLIRNYSDLVDEGISFLELAYGKATSVEELKTNLFAVLTLAHDPGRADRRINRARIVGSSGTSPEFTETLALEQERLRSRGQELIAQAQAKGWINPSLSPLALSSFIMAFTFGRVLDDICSDHLEPDEWNEIVRQFLDRVLLT